HRGEQVRLVDTMAKLTEGDERNELLIVTPYLIPVGEFLQDLTDLVDEGAEVRILTGSMGSNNHTMAHSHYKKYRKRILRTGASLAEFRHDPSEAMREISDVPPVRSKFISLHTKTLVGDREKCFIGSLNLDPRAMVINTENGLLIESPGLASELADEIEVMMGTENAWEVTLDESGRLRWESRGEAVGIQPARSAWQRVADFFFRLLPIEGQL
ncbi:MAG: phospholipase D-like domain-containing protein, partial [Verrucomicrobiales bacterium]